MPTEATYQFNSWRLSYRYKFKDGDRWQLWVGFTAKIRDAKIELRQGDTTSKDTDLGFVPLLHFAADWRFAERWHFIADLDGLAGGPGRAIDLALKVGYDINDRWSRHRRLPHRRGRRRRRRGLQLRLVQLRGRLRRSSGSDPRFAERQPRWLPHNHRIVLWSRLPACSSVAFRPSSRTTNSGVLEVQRSPTCDGHAPMCLYASGPLHFCVDAAFSRLR